MIRKVTVEERHKSRIVVICRRWHRKVGETGTQSCRGGGEAGGAWWLLV